MIQAMPDAEAIWQNPADMLAEWDSSPSKANQERAVADFAGPCGVLVDLGCGNGRYADVMRYQSYQGYDGSFAMIAEAQRRNPRLNFANVDIFRFQSDEVYDTLIMIDVAIHQIDPVAAARVILGNWQSRRYIITLLVGDEHEALLNSVVISFAELHKFLISNPAKRVMSMAVTGEKFTWNIIEIIKE